MGTGLLSMPPVSTKYLSSIRALDMLLGVEDATMNELAGIVAVYFHMTQTPELAGELLAPHLKDELFELDFIPFRIKHTWNSVDMWIRRSVVSFAELPVLPKMSGESHLE